MYGSSRGIGSNNIAVTPCCSHLRASGNNGVTIMWRNMYRAVWQCGQLA